MQHGFVADGDILADQQRMTIRIASTLAAEVQHGTVLYVAAGTDANVVHVAPRRHHGPDAGIVAEFDISHQGGARVYIYAFAQLRVFSFVGSQSQVHLGLLVFGHSSNLSPHLWISLYKSCGWL
ncbi:hypothetical protein D3C78_1661890 [compost metagenome]